MNLIQQQMNTKSVANSGALLVFSSVSMLTKLLTDVNACGHVPWAFFALDFGAIFVGAGLCYVGKPPFVKSNPPPVPPPASEPTEAIVIPFQRAA